MLETTPKIFGMKSAKIPDLFRYDLFLLKKHKLFQDE